MNRLFLIAILLLTAPLAAQDVTVHDGWTVRALHADVGPLAAQVPGVIHSDLLREGVIPDPFFGANEQVVAWVDTTTWVMERTVSVPTDWRVPVLVFDGIDTVADVIVDGEPVLRADNQFRRWTVPLAPGERRIQIVFHPAAPEAERRAASAPIPLPESPRPHLRKAAYHFGWDWGPRFLTSGLWREVRLEDHGRARLTDIHAAPEAISDAEARYTLEATVSSPDGGPADVRVLLDGREIARQRPTLEPGERVVRVPFQIANPERWWPRGAGEAHLYRLAVEVEHGGETLRREQNLGVRTVELDTTGGAFAFVVNGAPLFARGTNLAPLHSFYPVAESRYREVLQSAADAGMNMVRVWGGGVYEDDAFYALADSMGLMVWQDFMFGNAMYPGTDAFFGSVRAEAREQVRRLRSHPSIVLWCGGNEIREGWFNWGWQASLGYTSGDSLRVWTDYEALFEGILPEAVRDLAPEAPYWPSSPSNDWGRDIAYEQGDVHYWGVWWGRAPFETYRTKVGRFNSEYGFQGYPPEATVRTFASGDSLTEASVAFRNHQKHPTGFEWLREYAEMTWGWVPEDERLWRYMTQAMQAEGVSMAISGHRAAKPRTMGTLYWQLNDAWPVVSWSSVDHFGRWKPLHYRVRDLYQPLFSEVQASGDSLRVRLVSDSLGTIDAAILVEAFDTHAGLVRADTLHVTIPANGTMDLAWTDRDALDVLDDRLVFRTSLLDGNRMRYRLTSTLVSRWNLDLRDPDLRLQLKNGYATVSADYPALGVWLDAPDWGGTFTSNYFDVFPNEFEGAEWSYETIGDRVSVRSLFDLQAP